MHLHSIYDVLSHVFLFLVFFNQFLGAESVEANLIFDELHKSLSIQQGELAIFASELRQKFVASFDLSTNLSKHIHEFLDNIIKEARQLESHASDINEVQTKSITDFQKAYEEQLRSDAEKLVADMTSLVSNHICRQKELVNAKLVGLRETVVGNKTFLDMHVSSIDGIITDARRKSEEFSVQAGNDVNDFSDFSAAKHCHMEKLLQEWNVCNGNEQHDAEIASATVAAEGDAAKSSEDLIHHINSVSEQELGSISGVLAAAKAHSKTIEVLWDDHSAQSLTIEQRVADTFQKKFMDYEPTGSTPIRCEPEVPSNGTIESDRAMPMDTLVEEFRENHSFELHDVKETKVS